MADLADSLSEPRLLAFYDRLRGRMERAAARRAPRLGSAATDALLLVPDLFVLLARLALDRNVPASSRSLIGGALLYFVAPVDLFPEAVLGPTGFLEDVVLAAAVLSQALGDELEPYARRYWSGREELRRTLHDIAASARHLLGGRVFRRLERALARRGVALEAPAAAAPRERTAALPARRAARPVDPEFAGGFDDPGS